MAGDQNKLGPFILLEVFPLFMYVDRKGESDAHNIIYEFQHLHSAGISDYRVLSGLPPAMNKVHSDKQQCLFPAVSQS